MVSPPPNAFLIVQPVSEQEPCLRASRYQGEANADVNQTYGYYDCALQALITGWRAAFRKPTAYFGVVMLASYIHDSTCDPAFIAPLRETQIAGLRLPNVALVSATDLGDPGTAEGPGGYSPLHSVHPRNKRPLGARLASSALHLVYGLAEAEAKYASPRYLSASRGSAVSSAVVSFHDLPKGSLPLQRVAQGAPLPADPHGLSSQCPTQFGVPSTACAGFRLQTEDGAWHDATATVGHDGRHVELRCNATGAVVASSFGYSPWVVNSIFTKSGLPLLPWAPKNVQKTDDVLPPTVINSSLVHSDMYGCLN